MCVYMRLRISVRVCLCVSMCVCVCLCVSVNDSANEDGRDESVVVCGRVSADACENEGACVSVCV